MTTELFLTQNKESVATGTSLLKHNNMSLLLLILLKLRY